MSSAATQNSRQRPGHQTRRGADDSPEVKLSKFLSYVLRHGASKEGLTLRDDGSILLSTLQQHRKLQSTTFAQIKHIVDTNDKKRFTLFEEEANEVGGTRAWYIRATQGHSVDIKAPPLVLLTEETVPRHIIHGTTSEKVPVIQKNGLSRMQRTHIHFATGLAGDQEVVSGMRKTSDAFIYIDFPRAMQDGIEFYVSENNVVLSKGLRDSGVIPAEYFLKVVYKD